MKERKFCVFCGKELLSKTLFDGGKEKYCSECDHVFFHTPSPAVIVLVTDSERVLLARGVGWNHPYWGLISGHVMVGDTAEQTAVREVQEEVGLKVRNLELLGTYATKNRNLLMIAFKAESENTSINKSKELEKARWHNLSKPLPMRPVSTAARVVKRVFPKAEFMSLKQLRETHG